MIIWQDASQVKKNRFTESDLNKAMTICYWPLIFTDLISLIVRHDFGFHMLSSVLKRMCLVVNKKFLFHDSL